MMLDQLITLEKAAERLNMGVDDVQAMVESGEMRGAKLPDGSLAVREKSVAKRKSSIERSIIDGVPKEELPEYQQFKDLIGNPISVGEASRKYDIPHGTISRWASKGIIARVGTEKNRTLVDEADVAYCTTVFKQRGAKQGTWVFKEDGTPYIPRAA
jgi:hypothetical protein